MQNLNKKGGLSSYGLLLLLVTYFQSKEYEQQYQYNINEFPILGILMMDFFNFFISMELLLIQIKPFLPKDFVESPPYEPRQFNNHFIQIQGNLILSHLKSKIISEILDFFGFKSKF